MLQSAINDLNPDEFLPMLSVVDQDEHISTIPRLHRDDRRFHWVFKNMEFKPWDCANSSQVLWLSGPSECNVDQVSSYLVGQEKHTALERDHLVLYFFFSAATRGESTATFFVHTLLRQIVCCLPSDKSLLIIQSFLHSVLEDTFKNEAGLYWNKQGSNKSRSLAENVREILGAPASELLTALGAVLHEEQQGLSIVVDGLDKVEYQRGDFVKGVRAFVEHLQQRTSKVKILLTSRPQPDIKEVFNGLSCIEYDKERKGLVSPHI